MHERWRGHGGWGARAKGSNGGSDDKHTVRRAQREWALKRKQAKYFEKTKYSFRTGPWNVNAPTVLRLLAMCPVQCILYSTVHLLHCTVSHKICIDDQSRVPSLTPAPERMSQRCPSPPHVLLVRPPPSARTRRRPHARPAPRP